MLKLRLKAAEFECFLNPKPKADAFIRSISEGKWSVLNEGLPAHHGELQDCLRDAFLELDLMFKGNARKMARETLQVF